MHTWSAFKCDVLDRRNGGKQLLLLSSNMMSCFYTKLTYPLIQWHPMPRKISVYHARYVLDFYNCILCVYIVSASIAARINAYDVQQYKRKVTSLQYILQKNIISYSL